MTVVMNKWDKMAVLAKTPQEDKQNQDACSAYVRDVLDDCLHNSLYAKGKGGIDILPCCLVSETPLGYKLAKQLVQVIAVSLSRP